LKTKVPFTGAGLLLILSVIGLAHGRRVPAETQVLAKTAHGSTVTAGLCHRVPFNNALLGRSRLSLQP
jgi:hypothetical protein